MKSTRLISTSRRVVLATLATAALTGATAAPALAGDAKFLAYVKGAQQTTWNEPSHLVRADCNSHDYRQAHGGESVTWHSLKPEVLHLTAMGTTALVTYGAFGDRTPIEAGLSVKGTVVRSQVIQDHREASTCTRDLQQPAPPANDCGTRRHVWSVTMQLVGRKVQLAFTDSVLSLGVEPFATCGLTIPLITPLDGTAPASGVPAVIDGRVNPSALTRLPVGRTKVITATGHWSEVQDGAFNAHVSTAQTSRWQIRLLRLRGR